MPQTATQLANYARQAITTRHAAPTDHRDSCVVARCEAKRITVSWNDALDVPGNHAAAALKLMSQLGWDTHNDIAMGETGDGYVFVQVPKARERSKAELAAEAYDARCAEIRATIPQRSKEFANAMTDACQAYEQAMIADIGPQKARKLGAGLPSLRHDTNESTADVGRHASALIDTAFSVVGVMEHDPDPVVRHYGAKLRRVLEGK